MQIVSPQDWLSLATLGGLVVLGLIWSIVGRIPIAVQGQGLLMRPRYLWGSASSAPPEISKPGGGSPVPPIRRIAGVAGESRRCDEF